MTKLVIGSGIVCSFALLACAGTNPDGAGYVLLDPEARASGLTVQVGDRAVTSALPIEVASGAKVSIVGPDKNELITVGEGELVYVKGTSGVTEHLAIGAGIADDRLQLDGEDSAFADLARQLGATIDGRRLVVPGVYVAAATAFAPAELIGARPVEIPTSIAATGCKGVAGTWRSFVWSEPHQAYYDFTLKVRQPSPKSPALEGTVLAHSFMAPTGTATPPADCVEEWTVQQPATGRVEPDGTMRFGGAAWRVADTVCGDAPQTYSHDQFRVTSASTGTVFDSHAWVNGLDATFTRTSCE